jgi:hypothetical protein
MTVLLKKRRSNQGHRSPHFSSEPDVFGHKL